MMRLWVIGLALLFGAAACVDEQTEARKSVEKLEAELYSDTTGVIDPVKGKTMIETYMTYVDSFPSDTLVPVYLFKSAEVAQGVGDYWLSVKLFNRVYTEFPDHKKAPVAVFYQGFVLDNYLNQPNLAIKSFEELVQKYPEHELAREARSMIMMINSGDEYFDKLINKEE